MKTWNEICQNGGPIDLNVICAILRQPHSSMRALSSPNCYLLAIHVRTHHFCCCRRTSGQDQDKNLAPFQVVLMSTCDDAKWLKSTVWHVMRRAHREPKAPCGMSCGVHTASQQGLIAAFSLRVQSIVWQWLYLSINYSYCGFHWLDRDVHKPELFVSMMFSCCIRKVLELFLTGQLNYWTWSRQTL